MLKTQALAKWCPFARVPFVRAPYADNVVALSVNRGTAGDDIDLPPPVLCIADQCMAWRPSAPVAVREDGKERGFCGLTGP